MSSLALPSVILGEGKSLISKPGQDELVSVASSYPRRRKISEFKTRACSSILLLFCHPVCDILSMFLDVDLTSSDYIIHLIRYSFG